MSEIDIEKNKQNINQRKILTTCVVIIFIFFVYINIILTMSLISYKTKNPNNITENNDFFLILTETIKDSSSIAGKILSLYKEKNFENQVNNSEINIIKI